MPILIAAFALGVAANVAANNMRDSGYRVIRSRNDSYPTCEQRFPLIDRPSLVKVRKCRPRSD